MEIIYKKAHSIVQRSCPCCKNTLSPSSWGLANWTDGEGATIDCNFCSAELIIKGGDVLDFHAWLNSDNPSWPKDGKGTGYVDVKDI